MHWLLHYPRILFLLLSLVTHQCNSSDLNPKTILGIDDYQFHFSTFHYEFTTTQPLSAIIKHPFDDHLNITLDIDLNHTISLSVNHNLTLDFLNINDFREITYASRLHASSRVSKPSPHHTMLVDVMPNRWHKCHSLLLFCNRQRNETYKRRLYDKYNTYMYDEMGRRMKKFGKMAKKGGKKMAAMAKKAAALAMKHKDKLMKAGQAGLSAYQKMQAQGGGAQGALMGAAGDRRHKRDAWRRSHEAQSRWKRRERRRRGRKSRRRRFMHWLKLHYGTGVKSLCPGIECHHRHAHHIRVMPSDIDWDPLPEIYPLLGAKNPQMQHKIHIVAKVHMPKHRPIEGDLDYDLLNALLFGGDKVKKEPAPVNPVADKKQFALFEDKNRYDKMYNKWDEENDERMNTFDRRRRMLENDSIRKKDVYMVSHCRIVRDKLYYEVCMNYDAIAMVISVDIKSLEYRIGRRHKRKVFGDALDVNGMHYKDYRVVERAGNEQKNVGEYGFFEPIDGNLGYAIFKYESLDWHSVHEYDKLQGDNHEYGDFENFKHYIRFNQRFDLMFDGCSVTLAGLPFKMCLNGMILYFEKDASMDVLDPVFSFQMKEFIDKEFEESIFVFDDDAPWDEVNVINMEQHTEKCNYLHIAKVCMTRNNANGSITAYISFQFMNKAMPLLKETKRIMMSNVFDLLQNNAWQYDLILNTSHRASFVPLYLNIEEHILSNKTQWSRNHYNDDLLSCTIDISSLCLIQTRSSLILSYNNHLYHFTNHTQWSYSNQISIIPQHPENRRRLWRSPRRRCRNGYVWR
eukprot:780817_1